MVNFKPEVLLDAVDTSCFDDLDTLVHQGAKRFVELCGANRLVLGTSNNYQLMYMGSTGHDRCFFSFMGQQGVVFLAYLRPLPDDLMAVVQEDGFMDIIKEANEGGLKTSFPSYWNGARQMNQGIYDGAAQFDIRPPCLLISANVKQENDPLRTVEYLAKVHEKLSTHRLKILHQE